MGKPNITIQVVINKKDTSARVIYLLDDGNCIKNGITRDTGSFRGRLNCLRCGNSRDITTVAVVDCERAAFAEAIFAMLASHYLVRGSWYKVEATEAEVLMNAAINLAYSGTRLTETELLFSYTYDKNNEDAATGGESEAL